MSSRKNNQEKTRLHPRNKNRERYDLKALTLIEPELDQYVVTNKFGIKTLNFTEPLAVKLLNKAILHHYYGIKKWEFSNENLTPPIPGRADYIHNLADLLGEKNSNSIPVGDKITCFDIGTGASCIYPIIGVTEYGWKGIASDIDSKSIASAQKIVKINPSLSGKIECRLQANAEHMFRGVWKRKEKADITVCNPPFHASIDEARKGSRRKLMNLSGKVVKHPKLNFAGVSRELIYDGGEITFISNLINESKMFAKNFFWFSTLVSKQSNLKKIYGLLKTLNPTEIKEIPMGTGNKLTRIVAWTFLSTEEQQEWRETRW